MGRPKKAETGPVPTKERLLLAGMELFAERGYDAVSVRDITKQLGLNEASLYNHFKGKADLLAAIFRRLEDRLIQPGFSVPPPETFAGGGPFDLQAYLTDGARRFFRTAGRETLLTWRILMASQFQFREARDSLRNHILDAPRRFFEDLLRSLQTAGRIRSNVDCKSAGRVIAAVFFEYSFRSNLELAWNEDSSDGDFSRLQKDLGIITKTLEKPGRKAGKRRADRVGVTQPLPPHQLKMTPRE